MHGWLRRDFPIWRDAEQLLLEIEQAVRRFPRYHKYTLGTELRLQASRVQSCVTHAINHAQERGQWVAQLSETCLPVDWSKPCLTGEYS